MPELMTKTRIWRKLRLIALVMALILVVVPVASQDAARVLAPGSTLSDALGPAATATSYVFDAAVGSVATITVDSGNGQALALLLSDANGNVVALAVDDTNSGIAAIDDAALATGGRYFVVVYFAPGSAASETNFDITLIISTAEESDAADAQTDAAAASAPNQVLIAAGIEVRLAWTGAADMNLQVRDPSGQTLYWDSRVTNNGGVFGFDANGLCQVLSPEPGRNRHLATPASCRRAVMKC